MKDFVDVLAQYSLSDIVVILVAVYGAYYFIKKQIKEHKKEVQEQKESYHDEQRELEQHEETVESRLTSLEIKVNALDDVHARLDALEANDEKHDQWIGNDKAQISGLGTQLLELTNKVTAIADSFADMDEALTDLRLKQMREFILNSVSVCIDMTKPVSLEFYGNIQKTYEEYEQLLELKGKSNGYCSEAMKIIKASELRRAECGSYAEQLYIAPDKNKLKETAPYHPAWYEEKGDENE